MSNKIEEDIKQLQDLKSDRESFITGDKEYDEIFLKDIQAIENILTAIKNKIDDIQRLQELLDKSDANNVKLEQEVKKYKNMYEAEHRIHLVRNEQLERKERAVLKAAKHDALVNSIKDEMQLIKNKRSKLGFKTYLKREEMIREDSVLLGEQKALQNLLEITGEAKKC